MDSSLSFSCKSIVLIEVSRLGHVWPESWIRQLGWDGRRRGGVYKQLIGQTAAIPPQSAVRVVSVPLVFGLVQCLM